MPDRPTSPYRQQQSGNLGNLYNGGYFPIEVPYGVRRRILSTTDLAELDRCLRLAVKVASADERLG